MIVRVSSNFHFPKTLFHTRDTLEGLLSSTNSHARTMYTWQSLLTQWTFKTARMPISLFNYTFRTKFIVSRRLCRIWIVSYQCECADDNSNNNSEHYIATLVSPHDHQSADARSCIPQSIIHTIWIHIWMVYPYDCMRVHVLLHNCIMRKP